jgi:hypothetical protein
MNLKSILSLILASVAVVEAKQTLNKVERHHHTKHHSMQQHLRASVERVDQLKAQFGGDLTVGKIRDDIYYLTQILNTITNPSTVPEVAGFAPRVWTVE